jgi:hypothetical protein
MSDSLAMPLKANLKQLHPYHSGACRNRQHIRVLPLLAIHPHARVRQAIGRCLSSEDAFIACGLPAGREKALSQIAPTPMPRRFPYRSRSRVWTRAGSVNFFR